MHDQLSGNLLNLHGEPHRRQRALVQPAFSPQAAERLTVELAARAEHAEQPPVVVVEPEIVLDATAAATPVMPISPMPRAPSGERGSGIPVHITSICGTSRCEGM